MVVKMNYNLINGHKVIDADLRPILSKHTLFCVECGKTGLRKIKKEKCFE